MFKFITSCDFACSKIKLRTINYYTTWLCKWLLNNLAEDKCVRWVKVANIIVMFSWLNEVEVRNEPESTK